MATGEVSGVGTAHPPAEMDIDMVSTCEVAFEAGKRLLMLPSPSRIRTTLWTPRLSSGHLQLRGALYKQRHGVRRQ